MKAINFILICLLFSSCLTVKRIEKNCDKFAKVCITESNTVIEYRDTVIYNDRVVKVVLPKDTVKIIDTLYIDDNKCFLPYTYRKFGNVWASAKVDNSILDLKAGYVKNLIQVAIHDTIYIEKAITNTSTNNTVEIIKKYIPNFYRFTFWFFITLCVFGIGYGVYYFKGGYIKGLIKNIKK